MVKNPLKRLKKLLRRYCHRKTLPSNNAPTVNYYDDGDVMMESNKHAIAVAAATAVVAESALAAAKAAAEVVRLTSNNNASHSNSMRRRRAYLDDYLAAVKIQSAFRGYLARRALKALKGLVKIQALVRGYLVRKQSAQMLRRLQAMVRVQARARSTRVLHTEPSYCSPGKETPYPRRHEIHGMTEKLQDSSVLERCGSNSSIKDSKASEKSNSATIWFDNWLEVGSSVTSSNMPKTPCADSDKNNDKILEIDSSKPDINPKKKNWNNLSKSLQHISSHDYYNHSFTASDYLSKYSPTDEHNPISGDVSSMKSLNFTASNSRRAIFGASRIGSMRRSPKTPSRDECSESNLNGYSTFASPSYMANTQSSRAKTRSQSLPRQRGCDTDKVGSVKRSLQAFWESKTSSKQRL